jgi:ATP/maltotriose-dependent transcriptional regulator MalT
VRFLRDGLDDARGAEAGIAKATVKKHTIHLSEKLGVESHTAATLRAVEALA